MRTKLSTELTEIYNNRSELSYTSPLWEALLEARDTLEHHEKEAHIERERFDTLSLRYANLYESRQQMVKDFRVFAIGNIMVVILLIIGYVFS